MRTTIMLIKEIILVYKYVDNIKVTNMGMIICGIISLQLETANMSNTGGYKLTFYTVLVKYSTTSIDTKFRF